MSSPSTKDCGARKRCGGRRVARNWNRSHWLDGRATTPGLLDLLDQLTSKIQELTHALVAEVEGRVVTPRLMTHPGVGPLTALAFELVIGTPERFHCGKQVASYVGLVPSEESSGDRRRWGHISKQGNATIRASPGWKAQTIHESEKALFSECMQPCAQIVLDTADIVEMGYYANRPCDPRYTAKMAEESQRQNDDADQIVPDWTLKQKVSELAKCLALGVWLVLLLPLVWWCPASGMAFDSGVSLHARFFVLSGCTCPGGVLIALLLRKTKLWLLLLPWVTLVGANRIDWVARGRAGS